MSIKTICKKVVKAIIPYGLLYLYRKYLRTTNPNVHSRGYYCPDKIFYIIRRDPPGAGMFSNFHYVLGHIIFAIKKGYTPVVDMEYYRTYYNEKWPFKGTMNAWEYYFKQPTDYTLDGAYRGRNVIIGEMAYLGNKISCAVTCYNDAGKIAMFNQYISKYMQFQPDILDCIDRQQRIVFGNKQKILGVLSRGTSFNSPLVHGHPIVPDSDSLIDKVKELLEKWELDYIFLTTEEAFVVDKFKKAFGQEKVLVTQRARVIEYNDEEGSTRVSYGRENDNYLKGLEYIIDIALLSRCDALIGPIVNGTIAALELNNNKYKFKHIIDLGIRKD